MAGRSIGTLSPVHSRRLARTLRRWREQSGMSVERAAEELLCGMGTVSRMENGGSAEPLRVRAALELYGAPPKLIKDMVEAAKQRRRRGVLRRPYHDFVSRGFAEYLDLETEASELSCVQGDIVHGLLQTEDYVRALMMSSPELVAAADLEKFVQLRMERQEHLRDEHPLHVRIVLAESALHTEVGGKSVLRGQLIHLLDLLETADNVALRVLPFAAGAHPAVGYNFTVLSFADGSGRPRPEAIYTDNPAVFFLLDNEDSVERFLCIYDRVWSIALDSIASGESIRASIARLDR